MIRKLATAVMMILACTLGSAAFAGDPHTSGTKGQPNQSCEQSGTHPGRAASAPGSAFNDTGTAAAVYANPDSKGGTHSGNSHVVSQYDVACYQQSVRPSGGSAHASGHKP
jgi:hypothetical protein